MVWLIFVDGPDLKHQGNVCSCHQNEEDEEDVGESARHKVNPPQVWITFVIELWRYNCASCEGQEPDWGKSNHSDLARFYESLMLIASFESLFTGSEVESDLEDHPCLDEADADFSNWLDGGNNVYACWLLKHPYHDNESKCYRDVSKDVECQQRPRLVPSLPDDDLAHIYVD